LKILVNVLFIRSSGKAAIKDPLSLIYRISSLRVDCLGIKQHRSLHDDESAFIWESRKMVKSIDLL
jgi:hypothetical protein